MSARATSWLAWALCATTLSLLALVVLLIFLGWSTPLPSGWSAWEGQAILAVGIVGAPILGGLIASRRPENPCGWLLLGLSLGLALVLSAQVYATYSLVAEPGLLPAPRTVGHVVAGEGWMVAFTLLPLLLLLFPTGRLPSHRWRYVAWAVAVAGATALAVFPFAPAEDTFVPGANPLGLGGTVGEVLAVFATVSYMVISAATVPSALSLVSRYRRAGRVERQQLKWFAFAAVLFAGESLSQYFYEPPGVLDTLVEAVPIIGLYVAVGIAILAYRLYDIDLLINRTLVYGPLTATLALLYFGSVVSLQTVFRVLSGQESTLAIVASTLVIAALFNPLRRRVQGVVDRSFYRSKYDAAKTLEAFGSRLRDETNLDALSNDLVGVARRTMQPAHVSLWLRPDPEPEARSAALRQFGHE